jgi:hypothetical protein
MDIRKSGSVFPHLNSNLCQLQRITEAPHTAIRTSSGIKSQMESSDWSDPDSEMRGSSFQLRESCSGCSVCKYPASFRLFSCLFPSPPPLPLSPLLLLPLTLCPLPSSISLLSALPRSAPFSWYLSNYFLPSHPLPPYDPPTPAFYPLLLLHDQKKNHESSS